MKAIKIPRGVVYIVESKAVCPHCSRVIPFDEIEPKWMKERGSTYMRMKCLCKRFIGITCDITGDFVAFDLKK